MNGLVAILGSGESGRGAAILAKKVGYRVFVSDSNKFQDNQNYYLKNYPLNMKRINIPWIKF